jgi:hypothetical protein
MTGKAGDGGGAGIETLPYDDVHSEPDVDDLLTTIRMHGLDVLGRYPNRS